MSEALKITATYKVLTPMFLSGADQSKPELRINSIRGALRFWWRALAWSRHDGDLQKIKEEESKLFGSSDQKIGQGMLMRFVNDQPRNSWEKKTEKESYYPALQSLNDKIGLKYLAYGALNHRNELSHGVFTSSGEFQIECRLKISQYECANSLQNALIALGTFGSLGAKSRKGFGSLEITELKNNDNSIEILEQTKRIYSLLADLEKSKNNLNALPPYSAFSNATEDGCATQVADLNISEPTAIEALAKAGFEMAYFRGWGHGQGSSRKVGSKDALQNFKNDHQWYVTYKKSNTPPTSPAHPERIIFGLPHAYDKGSEGKWGVHPQKSDRRASPLLFHVYKNPEGKYGVVAIVLVSKFIQEQNIKVFFKPHKEKEDSSDVSLNISWKPILDFLTHCKAKRIFPASTAEVSNA